jgi:hypothetical protein
VNCTICHGPTDDRDPVRHEKCARRLDRGLADLPDLYALMGAVLAPGAVAGSGRVSGNTKTAPLPARIEPLSLREEMVPLMATWEADWHELRDMAPARRGNSEHDLAGIVTWLRAHLPWAIEYHLAVQEFAADVDRLVHDCRQAAGLLPRMMRIGDCPNVPDGEQQPCATALYADPTGDAIRCRRCGARWARGQWMLLGGTLQGKKLAAVESERVSA